jgi:predicted DNA-binding transcriptional regulator YafY
MERNIRCQKIYDFVLKNEGTKFGFREIAEYIFGTTALATKSQFIAKERMFYRDLEYMQDKLGLNVDIRWDEATSGYYIADKKHNSISEKLFEAYHFLQLAEQKENYSKFIAFEKRSVRGNYLFNEIFKAIKGLDLTEFKYYNYLHHKHEIMRFYPYYLKESKNRWYAIGVRQGQNEILSLGLYRINDFAIITRNKRKNFDSSFGNEKYYTDCIGAYNRPAIQAVDIALQFSRFQAEYLKAYPIHHSQKHEDLDDSTIIKLKMKMTPDFLMEIMQYGHKVKVLKPESLRNYLIKEHENALKVLKSESSDHLIEEEFLINK